VSDGRSDGQAPHYYPRDRPGEPYWIRGFCDSIIALVSGSSLPSAALHAHGIPAPHWQPFSWVPGGARVVLANPADAEADFAVGICHTDP
jgi:hypothetical protein